MLDTNVLVSAVMFPGGKPSEVVSLARTGAIEAFTSPYLIEELAHVLRDKFSREELVVELLIRKVLAFCAVLHPKTDLIADEESIGDDTRVLECAIEAQADYIVSGDRKHLLRLKKFRNCAIVSPAEFLAQTGL